MFQTIKVISIICAFIFPTAVNAALISRDSENALIYRPNKIATGSSILGFRTNYIQSSKRINSRGRSENLGSMFEETGVDSSGAYSNRYEFEATYLQMTPYWAYGLTSKWSVYFGVPFYQVQTKTISTTTTASLGAASKPSIKANSRRQDSPQNDSEQTFIGQAVLSTQYMMLNTRSHKLGFTQKLRFPSASKDDSVYFTHGAPEALGYGLGAGLNYEYTIVSGFSFISSAQGLVNLSDEIYVRPSSDELDESDRNPGDTVSLRATLEKSIVSGSYLQVGIALEQKSKDDVEADLLNEEPFEAAEAQRLLVAYEFRPEFVRRTELQNIVSGRVSYSHFLSGENVAAENSAALEIQIAY